jgi:choline kinase
MRSARETSADGALAVVILAAGVGRRLAPFNDGLPKWLTPIAGRPIADRQLEALEAVLDTGDCVVVVGGHRIDDVRRWLRTRGSPLTLHVIDNDDYEASDNWYSLLVGLRFLRGQRWSGPVVVLNGDLCAAPSWYEQLVRRTGPGPDGYGWVAVDCERDLTEEAMKVSTRRDRHGRLVCERIGKVGVEDATAEYVGMVSLAPPSWERLRSTLETYIDQPSMSDAWYEAGLQVLMDDGLLFPWSVPSPRWVEIDDGADLARAQHLLGR